MRNREEAAKAAEAWKTNVPGTCQFVTRTWFDAPSVGDFDGDNSSDAEDGWKAEPFSAKHFDRKPPRGVPVAFLGGSRDNGHRAISMGNGMIRSTDFNGLTRRWAPGMVGTGTLAEVERAMNCPYAGWSETMSGIQVPLPPAPEPPKPPQTKVNKARQLLKAAKKIALKKGEKRRAAVIQKALDVLPKK